MTPTVSQHLNKGAPEVLVVEKDPAEVADLGEAEQEDLQVAAVVDLAAVVVIAFLHRPPPS